MFTLNLSPDLSLRAESNLYNRITFVRVTWFTLAIAISLYKSYRCYEGHFFIFSFLDFHIEITKDVEVVYSKLFLVKCIQGIWNEI